MFDTPQKFFQSSKIGTNFQSAASPKTLATIEKDGTQESLRKRTGKMVPSGLEPLSSVSKTVLPIHNGMWVQHAQAAEAGTLSHPGILPPLKPI